MLCRTLLIWNARYYSSLIGTKQYDVVVSGGGMIGTTLACALAQNPTLKDLSILLVESGPEKKSNFSKDLPYSNRVSSINLSSKNLLDRIGAWDQIQSTRTCIVDTMKVWGHSSDDLLEFHKSHNYQDKISYIVENDLIVDAVTRQLQSSSIDVMYGMKVAHYELPEQPLDKVRINFESGDTVECKLLLGTDGANSQVRKAMNVQYIRWDYNEKGIVATVKVSVSNSNKTAWQRFIHTGTVALLPLSDEYSSLVWATTPDNAKSLLQMTPESFVDALNSEFNNPASQNEPIQMVNKVTHDIFKFFNLSSSNEPIIPPRVISVEDKSRAAFPLGFGHSVKYVGPSVALLGDSAHRIHPLAGQGVNLGFGDIACFVKLSEESVANGYPIGHPECLTKYESSQQKQNVPTMISIDLMNKVYRSSLTPVKILGNLGFQLVQAVRPIKRVMMSRVS
uniref:Ubiquinone biosynthesis monooxygenase COQ6, mitochondrial n=1 Tax=Cacopsylla melanoneura TaxID=428564 RepID=A0A8D8T4F6_9HEMI